MADKVQEKTEWIHCNECNRQTQHLLVAKYVRHDQEIIDEEMGASVDWANSWNVWECRGCHTLTGEKSYWFSETTDYQGRPIIEKKYFPGRKNDFLHHKEYASLPKHLKNLYHEVINSYNQSSFILAAMGLRALLEGIWVDKEVTGRDLKEKIENAEFIPTSIRKNLHGFRFLGNDAAHRLEKPQKSDLLLAISVIEDIMNFIYELDYKSIQIFKAFSKGRKC